MLAETARYLGAGLANLVNLLNPQVIRLTGWVAERMGGSMLEQVRAEAARHALRVPFEGTSIVPGTIEGNSVSLGAAVFALEEHLGHVGGRTLSRTP